VRKTGFSRFFIFRTDMVPNIDGNDRCFMILMHDQGQAVVEHEFGIWNIDIDDVALCRLFLSE